MVEEPETRRLCVTKAAMGVVEADQEEVLLETKMKPETIGDQGAVDFHNCGGGMISRVSGLGRTPQAGIQLLGFLAPL